MEDWGVKKSFVIIVAIRKSSSTGFRAYHFLGAIGDVNTLQIWKGL